MYENVEPEIIEDCQRQNCGKCEYCIEEFEYLQSK